METGEKLIWTADEVSQDVRQAVHEAIYATILAQAEKHSLNVCVVTDVAVSELEGVTIPEEESEELRARAEREGKSFTELVIEYVNQGLSADADFDRTQRLLARKEGQPTGMWASPSSRLN